MRPLSLDESGESSGEISLKELFNNPDLNINGIDSKLSLKDLIFLSCCGGWSSTLNEKTKSKKIKISKTYVENICKNQISLIDNVKRNPKWVKSILKTYARHIGTLGKYSDMLKYHNNHYNTISLNTFKSYIQALKELNVIDEINAWTPNIKAKTTIRKTNKRLFIDPSIAATSLNLTPKKLKDEFEYFGFVFENLCIRDLKVYVQDLGGEILFYNDKNGLEADCVIMLDDGRYALIEIKLGDNYIDYGAKNLLRLKDLINNKRASGEIHIPEPSFLAVITGDNLALTRPDGVKVIPIGCLKG